jgi:CheY-like chemotaxis protein
MYELRKARIELTRYLFCLEDTTIPNTFQFRILVVDDDPMLRHLGKELFESRGYEVHCAEDRSEGLSALKRSKPDLIVSDLCMPNMNGFEFLSVVRLRFPLFPVIVISGEFSGRGIPESVLADALFSKTAFRPNELFQKADELIYEIPVRAKTGRSHRAAVWVKNGKGSIAVTCTKCLRTFPIVEARKGPNEAECDFCGSLVDFELIGDDSW